MAAAAPPSVDTWETQTSSHPTFLSLRVSVSQPFRGDYLEISKNPKYQKLHSAVEEKVLLADVVNKINRANGKVGVTPGF